MPDINWNVGDIGKWLQSVEWYDNHSLQTWMDCKRLYYYHKLHPNQDSDGKTYFGLDKGIGNGGRFGSAIHAGLAAYYTRYGLPDADRRDAAFRAFDREYTRKIGSPAMEDSMAAALIKEGKYMLDSKHRRARGLVILDSYFDKYEREDLLWKPVDAELGFIVRYEDRLGLGRPPFWYVARVDGLFEHQKTGEWFILETKTTGAGAEREVMRLTFNRQPTGYVTGLRQFPDGRRIQGFFANAVLVAAQKIEFVRQFYPVNRLQEEDWVNETFNIVTEIRNARADGRLDLFYKNTGHCTAYGQCGFWDICRMGHQAFLQTPQVAKGFHPTVWHPFLTAEEDQ